MLASRPRTVPSITSSPTLISAPPISARSTCSCGRTFRLKRRSRSPTSCASAASSTGNALSICASTTPSRSFLSDSNNVAISGSTSKRSFCISTRTKFCTSPLSVSPAPAATSPYSCSGPIFGSPMALCISASETIIASRCNACNHACSFPSASAAAKIASAYGRAIVRFSAIQPTATAHAVV